MKKLMVAIILGGMIVSFQNCSKSNFNTADSSSENSQVNPVTESSVSTLKPSEAQAIVVPSSPFLDSQLTQSKSSSSSDLFDSSSLSLNPKTGVMSVLSQDGSVDPSKTFCLDSAQLAELEGLLTTSQICEGSSKSSQSSEVACTTEYKFPYAKLQFSDRDVKLGETFSGCETATDLCGDNSKNLQSFVAKIVNNLPKQTCNFQNL